MSVGSDSFPEALTYFPDPSTYEVGTRPYLQVIRRARAAVDIPIIASLNGTTDASIGYSDLKWMHGWGCNDLQVRDVLAPVRLPPCRRQLS
jgi:hypothetical protein